MNLPHLTEAMIRTNCTEQSFVRGEEYYYQRAVVSLVRRGQVIQAEVEGSQYLPYQVRITFDEKGITQALCSCPYDWGGWCKHIVAALLACLHGEEEIEERPPLEELLAELDRDQLQALLLQLAQWDPGLADLIEGQVAFLQSPPTEASSPQKVAPRSRSMPVDPAPYRRQVRYLLRSLEHMRPSEAYWHAEEVVDEVRQVLDQAWAFVEAGDGCNALSILEAITEEYLEGWLLLDDSDGYAGEFFSDLGAAWTEALLTAELTPEERQTWAQKLARWQRELADYGLEDALAAAEEAAKQGWDYPPLVQVLKGKITRKGAWEDEAPWYADDLAEARLNVLERQGRYQEYLYLAEAEGQMSRYLTMLVRLGRVQEAVEEGLQYLSAPGEALVLAQALQEHGESEAALRVAKHGLTLEGAKNSLATWMRDLASGLGKMELALEAAQIAFREHPELSAYLRLQELAGDRWPDLRAELLNHLRQTKLYYREGSVDIFLHEGLIEDAIAALEGSGNYQLIGRVVDAALESHPEWVISVCRRQAEPIMDQGQARYYHHAVRWLGKAKAAYQAAGREEEWRTYLEALLERHQRKYKLVPMLEELEG